MFNAQLYNEIISDWINGFNLEWGLEQVKSDYKIINDEVIRILNVPNENITATDIDNMYNILILSNILYENTCSNILPLDDGIYDLLVVKYKHITGKNVIGAVHVKFPDEVLEKFKDRELIPGVIYLSDKENKYIDNMIYHDDLYRHKIITPDDMLFPGVTYEKTISKRLKDTSHNNPELVGTLDKCKFVLEKQASDKGVLNDNTVNVLERDFFEKHIKDGVIDPNQIIDVIVELKYDGVSIEADILNKRIISARTRGDTANDVASDLTPLLAGYYLPNAPELNTIIGIKFEAIMTHENLEKYSRLKERSFANCRTAIISWISSSDAYQYRELVTLVPLATNIKDECGNPIDRLVEVELMNKCYCRGELLRYSVFSGDLTNVLFQIYKFAQEAEFMRRILPFMYDGIVVSYLDPVIRKTLGRKNSVNQYSMAVKFNTVIHETVFYDYSYTIGQNGEITPMIHYKPVEFFGTIHNKSSGHSYGNFKLLNLKPGDIIEVEYRNDVMPYVTKKSCIENDINTNNPISFPERCPCCRTHLILTDSSARCPNFNCSERSLKRMANMMSKLNIKGFAEEYMKDIGVTKFHKLMELVDRFDKESSILSRLGELTSQSLVRQLNQLKTANLPDWKLIGSLGFSDLAANTWKLIFSKFSLKEFYHLMSACYVSTPESLAANTIIEHSLLSVKGIGKATVETIINEYPYFAQDINYILTNIQYQDSMNNKLIKVRFTGIRDANFTEYLNSNGFDAGEGSVTKDTQILVIPFKGYNSGSKIKKAIQYGIQIKTIDELKNELGYEF